MLNVLSQYVHYNCIILLCDVYYTHVCYCVRAIAITVVFFVMYNVTQDLLFTWYMWCISPSSPNSHLPVSDSFRMTAVVTICQLGHLHSIIIYGALILIEPFSLCKINVNCLIWFPEITDHNAAREGISFGLPLLRFPIPINGGLEINNYLLLIFMVMRRLHMYLCCKLL